MGPTMSPWNRHCFVWLFLQDEVGVVVVVAHYASGIEWSQMI